MSCVKTLTPAWKHLYRFGGDSRAPTHIQALRSISESTRERMDVEHSRDIALLCRLRVDRQVMENRESSGAPMRADEIIVTVHRDHFKQVADLAIETLEARIKAHEGKVK